EDSRIVYDDGDSAGCGSKLSECGFPRFRVGDSKMSRVNIGRCCPLKLIGNVISSHNPATIGQRFCRGSTYSLSCSGDKYCTSHALKCAPIVSVRKAFMRKLTGALYPLTSEELPSWRGNVVGILGEGANRKVEFLCF